MMKDNWKWDEVEAVVLANGDYPSHPLPLSFLDGKRRVVCCDGAAERYIAEGHLPWMIVGDGDSLKEELRKKYGALVRRISEQEDNDLTKAIRTLRREGIERIAVVGATGRREDHTLGNISLLMDYLEQGLEVRMYTDYGLFLPCRNRFIGESYAGQQISIFNFSARGLKAEGLKYPIYDFSRWWQGTLNEAVGERWEMAGEGDFLLFLNY